MSSIKIKEAPNTSVTGTLKIPVGNVGDNEAHTITVSNLKSWITSNNSGGIRWADIREVPDIIERNEIATINGQSLLSTGNLVVEANTIQWSKVVNKPTIPTKVSDLDNDLNFVSERKGETEFQAKLISGTNIATINGYNLLSGGNIVVKGTEQLQSDWEQSKDDEPDYIKNKPTIPTVNNSTITIKQGKTTKGTFTTNSASNVTITLDEGGGGGTPTYTDTTDASATPSITINGNQIVRCTNANITAITFTYGRGYLSGNMRELTSTVYFTCAKSAPTFTFPQDSNIYGDFENMDSDTPYIISIQGNNFILTPSHITWDDVSEKPNVQVQPSVFEIGGTNNNGVWQVTIDVLQPNAIYKCTFATRVVVNSIASGCGTCHYATRIYMEYPHSAGGDKESNMYIQLPTSWKTIGMGGTMNMFRQDGEFNPFYLELRMGYAESVGNNYSV